MSKPKDLKPFVAVVTIPVDVTVQSRMTLADIQLSSYLDLAESNQHGSLEFHAKTQVIADLRKLAQRIVDMPTDMLLSCVHDYVILPTEITELTPEQVALLNMECDSHGN